MKQPNLASRGFAIALTVFTCFLTVTARATEPAGPLNVARTAHVAVALADGRALIAGGYTATGLSPSAEIYDPATGTFSTTAPLATRRAQAAAVRLADGRVLVIGGVGPGDANNGTLPQASAEIFDPATGTWSAGGSMVLGRRSPVALALPNGGVLVIGNASEPGCELYDVPSATFTAANCVATPRNDFAAAVLADGRVLVAGGSVSGGVGVSTAEIRDPATGTWSPTGSLTTARVKAGAVTLGNGKVLVAAGSADWSPWGGRASSELYDPVTGTFSATGSLATARSSHVMAVLGDGNVVATGGISFNDSRLASIERYDVALGTWRVTGPMSVDRYRHSATLLADGDVLLAGGSSSSSTYLTVAELVDPACVATAPSLSPASASFTPAAGTGAFFVTHVAGCSWKVTNNFTSWLTVTSGASGIGNGEVAYSVAANTGAAARTVTLDIEGAPHVVSQTADVCGGTSLSAASLMFSSGGGSSSVGVTAPAACTWTVTGTPPWITAPAGGTGNATITISAVTNAGGARDATLTIANRSLLVSQSANPCATPPTISPASRNVGFGATSTTVTITASSGCSWSNSGYPSWITMASVGSGGATLSVNVAANPGATERSSTFSVAGNSFTLTQAANVCATAALAPSSVSVGSTAGSGSLALTADAACTWTVSGAPAWMSITSFTSGAGNATISYSYSENTGVVRSATLAVAGRTAVVSQAAGPCVGATVSPTFSPTIATGGGSGSLTVTTSAACTWTVTSLPTWVTVTSSLPMTGSGTVTYSVAANAGTARSGSLVAAGASHTVSQSGVAPPATYCPSRGNSSSYEWIQQVSIAGQLRSTGNNGGYANLTTSTAPIALARPSNSITLSPGGPYTETWRIWIDFNGDSAFSDSEIVFTGSASGAINSSFAIPASAPGGTTRMRITMKWGGTPTSCEVFNYGEVEDYTVTY